MFLDQTRWRVGFALAWFAILAGGSYTLYEKYQRIDDCHALQIKQGALEMQADDQTTQLEDILQRLRR